MGHYHIELGPQSKQLCTIVLPWSKYEYKKLPMGLCNNPDIFQETMNKLFAGFENIEAYIDDLLVLTKSSFEDHLVKLNSVLKKLKEADLKINSNKSFFAHKEIESWLLDNQRRYSPNQEANRSNFENCTPNKPQRIKQFHQASQLLL